MSFNVRISEVSSCIAWAVVSLSSVLVSSYHHRDINQLDSNIYAENCFGVFTHNLLLPSFYRMARPCKWCGRFFTDPEQLRHHEAIHRDIDQWGVLVSAFIYFFTQTPFLHKSFQLLIQVESNILSCSFIYVQRKIYSFLIMHTICSCYIVIFCSRSPQRCFSVLNKISTTKN